MEEKPLLVELIRCDGGTQSRLFNSEACINKYRELMLEGHVFDAIIVFFDGTDYWLADGFHRVIAAKDGGFLKIKAAIHIGIKRDAILYSVGATSGHGLERTPADKRRAATILLEDLEWSQWSNVAIAKKCDVGEILVRSLRSEIESDPKRRSWETDISLSKTLTSISEIKDDNEPVKRQWFNLTPEQEQRRRENSALAMAKRKGQTAGAVGKRSETSRHNIRNGTRARADKERAEQIANFAQLFKESEGNQ